MQKVQYFRHSDSVKYVWIALYSRGSGTSGGYFGAFSENCLNPEFLDSDNEAKRGARQ